MTPDISSSFDPNLDFHWKGKHIFDKEIRFSPNQRFNLNQIIFSNTKSQSLLINVQGKPSLLEPSLPSTYLHFDGNALTWLPLVLSNETLGVLELKNGGTGWHTTPNEGLVYFHSNKLKTLSPATDSYLSFENNDFLWKNFDENVDKRIDNSSTLQDFKKYSSTLRITEDGISFDLEEEDEIKSYSISFVSLLESVSAKTDKTVRSENIIGTMLFEQGGLGFNTIDRGDIVLATDDNILGKLSSKNLENHILTVKNGVPQWAEINIKNELRTQLNKFNFIQESNGNLVFNGEKEYQLSTVDSNINGSAKTLSTILNIDKGGTGLDLSSSALGSVFLKSTDSNKLYVLNPGENGQALISNGANQLPSYKYPVSQVQSSEKIKSEKIKDELKLDINTDAEFNWQGNHQFNNTKVNGTLEVRSLTIYDIDNSSQTTDQIFRRNGELYFNKNGIEVCLTDSFTQKENHILKICDNSTLKTNCVNPFMLLVPFTSSKAQNGDLWKLKRVDIYCHTPPKEDIEINLVCNNDSILYHNIVVNAFVNKASSISFSKDRFISGDMIFIKTLELNEADNFTIWAVVEKI
jgi:hypothetical protein